MTITLSVDTDEPVIVLVVPVRRVAPRSQPPAPPRAVIDTSGEESPSNVLPLRKAS